MNSIEGVRVGELDESGQEVQTSSCKESKDWKGDV